jgi:predicted transcriptional regulator
MTIHQRARLPEAREPKAREKDEILPAAEMEILAVLHARGEVEARDIRESLSKFRPMSHASVLTLLGRLETKALVTRRRAPVGKAFLYAAAGSPGPMYRSLLRRLMERIFTNDPARLVASLFEAKAPTEGELRQIRELVDDLQSRNAAGPVRGRGGKLR